MAVILRGDQGTFTFTSGNNTISSLDIDNVEVVFDRPITQVRPFGYALPKAVLGGKNARIRFMAYQMDGATAGDPGDQTATSGVVVFGVKSTTQKYTFKAIVHRMTASANSTEGTPNTAIYEGVASADSSSDTITPA